VSEQKPLIDGMEVQLRADWQREVAGFKVLLHREGGGYRLEVWRDLEEVKSWSVRDEAGAKAALEELRELLLEKVEPETAGEAEKLLEELRGRFERSVRAALVIEEGGEEIRVLASDGAVLKASMFFYEGKDGVEWLGELTYLVAEVEEKGEEEGGRGKRGKAAKLGLFPFLALAKAVGGKVVERKLIRVRGGVIDLDGVKMPLEFKAQLDKALDTMLDLGAVVEWLKGREVKVSEVYPKLLERVKRFVNFNWDPRLYHVVSCYIVATYFAQVFPAFPQLHFVGSISSGKTRAGLAVARAARRGLSTTDTSEASIFRIAEGVGATLLIDDVWGEGAKIAHLTYKKGVSVPRVEKGAGERLLLRLFETYCPTVYTGVELPIEHKRSRAIVIGMRKAPDPNPEGRDPEPRDFEDIRRELYICELTQFPEVKRKFEELARQRRELGLEGRDFEVWGPLLAVAALAGKEAYDEVLKYAKQDVGRKVEEMYLEEKEVLSGLERLLLSKAEELFTGELERLWKGEEKNWEPYREKLVGITAKLEEGVLFSAADLLRAMKEVLARKEGEEGGEKPYTMKQFESRWTVQRLGRFLSARLEDAAPFEKKTRGVHVRRIKLSSFLAAAERYGYEPDERLLKLARFLREGERESEKKANSLSVPQTVEAQTPQQSGSVSVNDTSVGSLSAKGERESSPGRTPYVSAPAERDAEALDRRRGEAPPEETPSFSPGQLSLSPSTGKSADKPFLTETVQPREESGKVSEEGSPKGEKGELGGTPTPSLLSENEEFEEVEGAPPPPVASAGEPRRNGENGEMEKVENEEACPYWNGEYCGAAGYASFRSEVLEKGRRPPCLGGSDKCPWGAWRLNALRRRRLEEEMAEEAAEVWGG